MIHDWLYRGKQKKIPSTTGIGIEIGPCELWKVIGSCDNFMKDELIVILQSLDFREKQQIRKIKHSNHRGLQSPAVDRREQQKFLSF